MCISCIHEKELEDGDNRTMKRFYASEEDSVQWQTQHLQKNRVNEMETEV